MDENKLNKLQDALKTVGESPLIPTPILVHKVENTENLCCATIHPSMKLLATGNLSSEIRLWDLSETKQVLSRHTVHIPSNCDIEPIVDSRQKLCYVNLRGHYGPVCDIGFLSDPEILLSASSDNTMRAWKIRDYSCAAVYRGHNYPLWCLAVSPGGFNIATGSRDRTARIWNLDRTYPLRVLAGHTADVNCMQFHPNGCYVATGSIDKSVRLWSVTVGHLVRVFIGHTDSIQALAFSPNGKYIVSAGVGGDMKVWDIAGGRVLANLNGKSGRKVAVDWSKCGSLIASAASDGSIEMWDVDSAIKANQSNKFSVEPLCQCVTGCESLLSLQFSSRNSCIVVGANF